MSSQEKVVSREIHKAETIEEGLALVSKFAKDLSAIEQRNLMRTFIKADFPVDVLGVLSVAIFAADESLEALSILGMPEKMKNDTTAGCMTLTPDGVTGVTC